MSLNETMALESSARAWPSAAAGSAPVPSTFSKGGTVCALQAQPPARLLTLNAVHS